MYLYCKECKLHVYLLVFLVKLQIFCPFCQWIIFHLSINIWVPKNCVLTRCTVNFFTTSTKYFETFLKVFKYKSSCILFRAEKSSDIFLIFKVWVHRRINFRFWTSMDVERLDDFSIQFYNTNTKNYIYMYCTVERNR